MYYISGDCQGNFTKISKFCRNHITNKEDVIILLGDVGINWKDKTNHTEIKELLAQLPITLFCIHGNREVRPYHMPTYEEKEFLGGVAYFEPQYPNLIFGKDGEIYDFGGKRGIVIGGAYTVGGENGARKLLRYREEQPTRKIKEYVEQQLEKNQWKIDYVLSHTCPLQYQPTDLFLDGIDADKVDQSTEIWMSQLAEKLDYTKWYFAHYHGNREYDDAELLYEEIKQLGSKEILQKIGKPRYSYQDCVVFHREYRRNGEVEIIKDCGRIDIIDIYGTFWQEREVSYDIKSLTDGVLYKHIDESQILYTVGEKNELSYYERRV